MNISSQQWLASGFPFRSRLRESFGDFTFGCHIFPSEKKCQEPGQCHSSTSPPPAPSWTCSTRCADAQFLSGLTLKMCCQISFLTLPSQMGRKGQLNWQSASQKRRSKYTLPHLKSCRLSWEGHNSSSQTSSTLTCLLEELAPQQNLAQTPGD